MRNALLLAFFSLILMGCSFFKQNRDEPQISTRGMVCDDPAIKGELIGKVGSDSSACGIEDAVLVRSIGGVTLSQPSLMECNTAHTLKHWMDNAMTPAFGDVGGGVSEIKVASHYACRTRNSVKGARLSEHAKGRAIDIAAFHLRDGTQVSVLDHWGGGAAGRILSKLHASACGAFGTVLGPNSDRHHQDHFHFDTAEYRMGSYCK